MKKVIISLIIGLIIGFVAGITVLDCLHVPVVNKCYGVLEAVYFISTPLATLITFLAVIVAIFGNEIRMWLYREKCDVSIDRNIFVEDISGQEYLPNIEARKYDCTLCVENIGSSEIEGLGLFIKNINYQDNKDAKVRKIKILNQKALYWNKPDELRASFLPLDKKYVPILRIHPNVTTQTPDDLQSSVKPLHISIMGHSLDDRFNKRGIWEIDYTLSTTRKLIKEFTVKVSWTGVWKQREKEMCDEVTVELKKK